MKLQTRRPKEDPEINLISLIDIALLLVIFFMLSSTFMQEGRIKIELPGYRTFETEVSLLAGQKSEVKTELVKGSIQQAGTEIKKPE